MHQIIRSVLGEDSKTKLLLNGLGDLYRKQAQSIEQLYESLKQSRELNESLKQELEYMKLNPNSKQDNASEYKSVILDYEQ